MVMRLLVAQLNVEIPEGDERTSFELLTAIRGAIEVGWDDESVAGLKPSLIYAGEMNFLDKGKIDFGLTKEGEDV